MKVLFAYRNSESIGIEYISSLLKKHGHQTDLIFDPGVGDVEFKFDFLSKVFNFKKHMLLKVEKFVPDLIAFSSMTNLFPWVKLMAREIKKRFNIPILVGGLHATIAPEEVLESGDIDFICRGEGEYATLELVNNLESGESVKKIRNIWVKKQNKILKNPLRPLINNLDDLPFPDKDLFFQYGAFSKRYYILSARGCPFECTYCYNKQLKDLYGSNNYYRLRSVDNIIEELKWAKKRYDYEKIYFYDDIFGLNKRWLLEFVQRYEKSIGLPYKCLLRPQNLTKDKLKLLKKSGCAEIDVGLESGNERVRREILNRQITDKELYYNLRLIKDSGIEFSTLNIIGNPTETIKELMDTYKLNYKIKPNGALFHILYPFPDTDIFKICLENNELNKNQVNVVKKGFYNYRTKPILARNYQKIIRFNIFAPILLKLPKFFSRFLFKLPPIKPFRILSMYFLTTPKNFRLKAIESLLMFIRSINLYSKRKN